MICRAGVPQVVLPQWYDTYDFANKAEYLGIGVYASRSVAPNVEAQEFSEGVKLALGHEITAKARMLRDSIVKKGEGRVIACREIDKLISQFYSDA
jgi:UDP:flavonoid glycosyltransferase YjiC (YdhE family)